MSKLYVSCIVVALLAVAVMPAMAAQIIAAPVSVGSGDWSEVVVSATVPEYINMDALDLTIAFGELADATNVGYVTAADTAGFTISTNVPLWVVYNNGDDLEETGSGTYKLDLELATAITGWWDWGGGMTQGAGEWTPWGGCGTATTAKCGIDLGADDGQWAIQACQQLSGAIKA